MAGGQSFAISFVVREKSEPPPGSEFLSFFSVYIADFLSHMGKWVRLIKFDAEYEYFYTCVILWFFNLTSTFYTLISQSACY